ncbi:MAG TPA: heavy metal translocating P-type ATPase [Gemmatimonadaceae bacterium]|nr:heavy metal translocating P-type ATPase [Gemmatimonadaceae bacterium]
MQPAEPAARMSGAHDAHGVHDTHGAHDKHAGHSVEMFRKKFWGTLALSIPTLLWAPMLQHWFHYAAPTFPGARFIPAIFGAAVFFYGGWVFIRGAKDELADRRPGMMTLIALAITVAFLFSLAVTFGYPGMDLWWELATLVTIMVLGHWIEMRSIAQASGALKELTKLLPSTATRVAGDALEEVRLTDLRVGDVVLVRPGASVPADGAVIAGESDVDESMITGESVPVAKKVGSDVVGGTLNGSGSLRVRITHIGDDTALAGIMRLVERAQTSRSRAQALADRAAFALTIIAIAAAILTFVGWRVAGASASFAIERVVTVLVIACPHALGLAIPLVVAISTTLGARNGLLVRDRRGLEEARNLTAIFVDKTGTLTRGEFRVVDVATLPDTSADDALRLAAAVERDSEHPIARGVVATATDRKLKVPPASDFVSMAGQGASARVDGHKVSVGGPALLRQLQVDLPSVLAEAVRRSSARGQATITVLRDDSPVAVLAMADAVRPESREAVRRIQAQGVRVIMITGDAEPVARAVASDVGISEVFAQVAPEQKAAKVEEVKRSGARVGMVGDGVNDAPALLTADVGVAIGAGTNVAVEAGDVVLVRNDPRDIPRIIELSRATYRKMVQNLWWAAGYNIVALPLAAGVAARWGIVLQPAVGAVLMSLSTIIVAANAQLLRRVRL